MTVISVILYNQANAAIYPEFITVCKQLVFTVKHFKLQAFKKMQAA